MASIEYDPETNEFYEQLDSEKDVQLPQIIWHITDRCFLSCPYCFATKTGKEADLMKLEEIIALFKELGVKKVDIAGGDPMTFDSLQEVCEKLLSAGISQTITTSGVGKEPVKDWLIQNCDFFSRIIVSIDGATPEDHNRLRGEGVFEKLHSLTQRLKHKNFRNLRINTVVTQHFHDEDNCRKIVSLIKVIDPIEWCLIQTHPANKKTDYDFHAISNDRFNHAVQVIKDYAASELSDTIQITERKVENYSKYWILSSSGRLSQHTNDSVDQFDIEFELKNLEIIKRVIADNGFWVPIKKI